MSLSGLCSAAIAQPLLEHMTALRNSQTRQTKSFRVWAGSIIGKSIGLLLKSAYELKRAWGICNLMVCCSQPFLNQTLNFNRMGVEEDTRMSCENSVQAYIFSALAHVFHMPFICSVLRCLLCFTQLQFIHPLEYVVL